MIYTFLICAHRERITDLNRIRTISAFGSTEADARRSLAGLPLVFVARRPAGEVAA